MWGRILVLGASGYIGSQLVPELLDHGHRVRAVGRTAAKLGRCLWRGRPSVELVETDLLDRPSLERACRDCEVIYYLVHSMNPYTKDFAEADRKAAQNTIDAAAATGIRRIIYLGGLGENDRTLSKHLRSRMEVLRILHSGKVPATSLRAAMIIGRGSIPFEIMRCLVGRFRFILAPSWVSTQSQPIAVCNVIQYLVGCLSAGQTMGEVFDIGGPDILSYRQLMDIYGQEAGLKKRIVVPVPVPVPAVVISEFMTPYPRYITAPLFEGLKNRMICKDNRIRGVIAQHLLTCRQAIRQAIK